MAKSSPAIEPGLDWRHENMMARVDQTDVRMRIVIDRPVIGVMHSLQAGNEAVLDPRYSKNRRTAGFRLFRSRGPRA
jgi:hypothetical protein